MMIANHNDWWNLDATDFSEEDARKATRAGCTIVGIYTVILMAFLMLTAFVECSGS